MNCYDHFSQVSGLSPILLRSDIFFRGVSGPEKRRILEVVGVTKGKLTVKYLSIPLITKRTSVQQWQPLVDNIVARVTSGTVNFCLMLIKSALFSMQSYCKDSKYSFSHDCSYGCGTAKLL